MSTAEIIHTLMPLLPLPIAMLSLIKWVRERLNLWLASSTITAVLDFVMAGYYTLTDDPVFAILWGVIGCLYIQNCRNIIGLKKTKLEMNESIAKLNEKELKLFEEHVKAREAEFEKYLKD